MTDSEILQAFQDAFPAREVELVSLEHGKQSIAIDGEGGWLVLDQRLPLTKAVVDASIREARFYIEPEQQTGRDVTPE